MNSSRIPYDRPPEPLPPPLRGEEVGTFAHYTVTQRLPRLARRVLEHNDYPEPIQTRLHTLLDEIPHSPIRPLDDPSAPDAALWADYLAPHLEKNWFQAPWFFVESYFFRRILAATGYFGGGPAQGQDPYRRLKEQGFTNSEALIQTLCEQAERLSRLPTPQALPQLLRLSLWGNQADLSVAPVDDDDPEDMEDRQREDRLLVDQAEELSAYLTRKEGGLRVDMILDNTGPEFTGDLILVCGLLDREVAQRVVLHPKPHPTYISDTTRPDVDWTLERLERLSQAGQALAARVRRHLEQERLQFSTDLFWTSPHPAWEMPSHLRQELSGSDLLIFKGDANYRRLLGDLHWPFTSSFETVLRYRPAPLVTLRTLKSEVLAGLAPGQPEALSQRDPNWQINGLWGVLQFAP